MRRVALIGLILLIVISSGCGSEITSEKSNEIVTVGPVVTSDPGSQTPTTRPPTTKPPTTTTTTSTLIKTTPPATEAPDEQEKTETKEVIKYQCYNGSIEERLSNCDEPEAIIKYQCQDGTVKDSLSDCDIIEINPKEETIGDIDYKFSDYNDYQDFVKEELEDLIGMEDIGNYGGPEARYNGSVYFLYFKKGEWDFFYYSAVEVDAETGELIKYKDITASDGSRDRFDEIWWTPER